MWQLIPQLPGLWLHTPSDACCLSSLCPLSTLWLLPGAHTVCRGMEGGGEGLDLRVCPGSVLGIGRIG